MQDFLEKAAKQSSLVVGLYVVATPIGNREDLTLRGYRILRDVDAILCENPKKSLRLLMYYGIQKPLQNYRGHRIDQEKRILAQLTEGKSLAYITDAGTPGIQDPVARLIRRIRQENICPIFPIPGASALSATLSISGMQVNPCLFLGYLHPRAGRRRTALQAAQEFAGIIVIYESPHRLQALLQDLAIFFAQREILIARELTKIHEEIVVFSLADLEKNRHQWAPMNKGEFTLVIGRK